MTQVIAAQSIKPPPDALRFEVLEGAPARVAGIRPGLEVRGMDRGQRPVADWLCRCGHHERATGPAAVERLASRVVVDDCPHRGGVAPVIRLDARRRTGGAR